VDLNVEQLRSEARRPLPWSVLSRFLHLFDQVGTLIGLLALVVTVIGYRLIADSWISVWLLAGLVPLLIVFAIYDLLRARTRALRQLLDRADITVAAAELATVITETRHLTLVRLTVRNRSPGPRRLTAKVTAISGFEGPEVPWPIRWRHGADERVHTLFPGDEEMLEVIELDRTRPRLWFHVVGGKPAHVGIDDPEVAIVIAIWDADTGHEAARVGLRIDDATNNPMVSAEILEPATPTP
jgi:hypothetical protein